MGLVITIDRVDEVFVQAPVTTGVRFSGGVVTDVSGGKSAVVIEIGDCVGGMMGNWLLGWRLGDIVRE